MVSDPVPPDALLPLQLPEAVQLFAFVVCQYKYTFPLGGLPKDRLSGPLS